MSEQDLEQKVLREIFGSEKAFNRYLEDKTFRNILHFRRENLMKILEGESAVEVIPESNQRSKLLRDGVFTCVYRKGGKHIKVSDKAKRILLEEIIEDE